MKNLKSSDRKKQCEIKANHMHNIGGARRNHYFISGEANTTPPYIQKGIIRRRKLLNDFDVHHNTETGFQGI